MNCFRISIVALALCAPATQSQAADASRLGAELTPSGAEKRGNAELKTGQALWASYIENSRQLRDWENEVEPTPEGVDIAARKVVGKVVVVP